MAPSASEDDIMLNKINIALAKSQREIASWLRPPRVTEPPSAKTKEEIEKEEQEIFVHAPETLGMGATVPRDGEVKREDISSNDKLRKKLLGQISANRHGKGRLEDRHSKSGPVFCRIKPHTVPSRLRGVEDDSEDDGGRSSLGKSKHATQKHAVEQDIKPGEKAIIHSEVRNQAQPEGSVRPPKRGSNYLDEVLATRSHKNLKKSKAKKQNPR